MKEITLKRKNIVDLVNDLREIHEKIDSIMQTEKGFQLGVKIAEQVNKLNFIEQNLKSYWLGIEIDKLHLKAK